MRAVDRLRWGVRRHPARLVWVLALLWIVTSFRLLSNTGGAIAGIVDDLAAVAGGLLIFALLERAPRACRLVSLGAAAVGFTAFHVSALFFFRFFQAFITVDTLRMAPEAGAASSAVVSLASHTTVVALIVVPIALAAGTIVLGSRYRRRRASPLAAGALFLLVALGGGHARMSQESFFPSDNNPLMFLARDALAAISSRDEHVGAARRLDLFTRRDETYNRSSHYEWAPWTEYPLLKLPAGAPSDDVPRRNVVLVLMESVRGFETGLAGTGDRRVAPKLMGLAEGALHFPNLYFNGSQTGPGEVAVLCSLLPAADLEVIYLSAPNLAVKCLPHVLKEHGYSTHWFKAFRGEFMGTAPFLARHGIDIIYDEDEIRAWGPRHPPIGWGIADEDLFDFVLEKLRAAPEPFFAGILTLSNHYPAEIDSFGLAIPESIRGREGSMNYRAYLMGMHYTDHAVGEFLDRVRREPWFANTLFVILGDHGVWSFPDGAEGEPSLLEKTEMYLRGGLLLWAPRVIPPGRNPVLGSQIDIAPTVLGLLGITTPNAFQGVSLLDSGIPPADRFALYVGKGAWNFREEDAYCYALRRSCFPDVDPRCPPGRDSERLSHACFRLRSDLLTSRSPRGGMELLDGSERRRLMTRAQRLIDDTTFLVAHDALFPRVAE